MECFQANNDILLCYRWMRFMWKKHALVLAGYQNIDPKDTSLRALFRGIYSFNCCWLGWGLRSKIVGPWGKACLFFFCSPLPNNIKYFKSGFSTIKYVDNRMGRNLWEKKTPHFSCVSAFVIGRKITCFDVCGWQDRQRALTSTSTSCPSSVLHFRRNVRQSSEPTSEEQTSDS